MHMPGFAHVNGTRLYYEAAGSGHPLVLIHPTGLDRRLWDDHFEALASRYRAIRYDVRGFGRSDPPSDEPYRHADDLKALLDDLGVSQAHVMGLCLGGGIAIDLAIHHPQKVTALVVADVRLPGYELQDPEAAQAYADVRRVARESGLEAARECWLARAIFAPARGKPDVFARLAEMVADYSGWHWTHDDPITQFSPPALQRLHEIGAPTLVLVGEHDLPDWKRMCEIVARNVPGARHVVLPDAGHFACMENPAAFSEAVRGFLADAL